MPVSNPSADPRQNNYRSTSIASSRFLPRKVCSPKSVTTSSCYSIADCTPLEDFLAEQVLPGKQEIVRETLVSQIGGLIDDNLAVLESRKTQNQ